jgi:hypothetical protein
MRIYRKDLMHLFLTDLWRMSCPSCSGGSVDWSLPQEDTDGFCVYDCRLCGLEFRICWHHEDKTPGTLIDARKEGGRCVDTAKT